jgi:hypothetical protein
MSDEPVSISAASLQAMAEKAWGKVLDRILHLLQTKIDESANGGFFDTPFSIWDLSRDDEQKISDPGGGSMLNECDEEALWLMLFARLEGSGLRIRHSTESMEGTNAVNFFWGTAEQLGMTHKEFACLRVL